jgi:HEAT repeat protein
MIFLHRGTKSLAKEDPKQFERQKAQILKLLKRPNSEAIDTLFSVVKNYENPILVKIALTVLSEMKNPEAITVLSNCMFEHKQRLHRGDAARALGYSRSSRAIAPLKRLLQSPFVEAEDLPISEGLFAVMTLSHLGILKVDNDWLIILKYWQSSDDAEHRLMARLILQSLRISEATA